MPHNESPFEKNPSFFHDPNGTFGKFTIFSADAKDKEKFGNFIQFFKKNGSHPMDPMGSDVEGSVAINMVTGETSKCSDHIYDDDRPAFNPFSDVYENENQEMDRNPRFMFPSLYSRKKTGTVSPLYRFVVGNPFSRAFLPIMSIYAVMVIVALIIINFLDGSSIFPFDNYVPDLIFNIYTFFIAVLSGGAISIYNSLWKNISVNFSGTTEDFILHVMENVKNTSMNIKVLLTKKSLVKGVVIGRQEKVTVLEILIDIAYLTAALPYVFKHIYREESEFNLEKLPLKEEIKDQLRASMIYGKKTYPGHHEENEHTGLSPLESYRLALTSKLHVLVEHGHMPNQAGTTITNLFNQAFGQIAGELSHDSDREAIPNIQRQLIYVILFVFCLFVPFVIYDSIAVKVGLPAYFVAMFVVDSVIIGFFTSTDLVTNPFSSPDPHHRNKVSDQMNSVSLNVLAQSAQSIHGMLTQTFYHVYYNNHHREESDNQLNSSFPMNRRIDMIFDPLLPKKSHSMQKKFIHETLKIRKPTSERFPSLSLNTDFVPKKNI